MSNRMLPAIRGEFWLDVHEFHDDVIVFPDLLGGEKELVSLQFINPRLEVWLNKRAMLQSPESSSNNPPSPNSRLFHLFLPMS